MPNLTDTPVPLQGETVPAPEPVGKPRRPRKRWFLLLAVLALLSGDALLSAGEAEGMEPPVEVPAAVMFRKLTPTAEELAALLSTAEESVETVPEAAHAPETEEAAPVPETAELALKTVDTVPETLKTAVESASGPAAGSSAESAVESASDSAAESAVESAPGPKAELASGSSAELASGSSAEPTAGQGQEALPEPAAREADWMVFQGRSIRITPEAEWCGYQPGDFVWDGDRVRYTGTSYDAVFGIDVSRYHNEEHADGRLDWTAAREDGVEFAIIRAGGRGSSEGKLYEDKYFTVNVEDAHAAGILTGAYIYSQAVSVEEALEEAEFLLSRMEGLPIDGPVCYDWEVPGRSSRAWSVPPETATAAAAAFCARIAEAGYTPLIYESKEVGYLKYDQAALEPYMRWYPQYPSRKTAHPFPDFRYHMALWQFSDRCTVAGIGKRTDGSLWLRPRAAE